MAISPAGENGKSKKLSRTEVAMQKAEAELQARQALVQQSQRQQGPQEGTWRLSSVVRYDSRSMTGIVSFGGGLGRVEAQFGGSAMRKSGLVSLHPTQSLECFVVTQPDGSLTVTELRLSPDGRKLMSEAERQRAQDSEERYEVMSRRRVR